MRPSVAFVLLSLAAASAAATSCTQRHRLGGRYDDGAGGEAGASDTPSQGSGASPSTGGSGAAPSTGGTTGSGATGGSGGGAGAGSAAGASGYAQQPDPGVLL